MIPEPIRKFIESFSRLPSIGPRLASRLAFSLTLLDKQELEKIKQAIWGIQSLERCPNCFFFRQKPKKLCDICANPSRNPKIVAIVENETDLLALEQINRLNSHYLILGEITKDGLIQAEQKFRLQGLKNRIKKDLGGQLEELIIALNPNTFADLTSEIISQEFKTLAKTITRLGRGMPTGGEIEFADEETLIQALERRH